ncbi:MAG: hypothetical protein ABTQ34_06075 [Bdellovibrionales bacterium]
MRGVARLKAGDDVAIQSPAGQLFRLWIASAVVAAQLWRTGRRLKEAPRNDGAGFDVRLYASNGAW